MGTDTTRSVTDSFRKKLQDCETVEVPIQQMATSGGGAETDDGIQEDPGMVSGFSGICCILEGLEMPNNPLGVTQTLAETSDIPAAATITGGAVAQEMSRVDGQEPDGTPKPIAWTQNTTAGQAPANTQDDILKAVGAYLDDVDTGAESNGAQTRTIQTAQTDAPNSQPQTVAAAQPKQPEVLADGSVPDALQGRMQAGADGQQNGLPGEGVSQGAAEQGMGQKVVASETAEKRGYAAAEAQKREAAPQATLSDDAEKPQAADMPVAARAATPASSNAATADTAEAGGAKEAESAYTKENVLRIVDKASTLSKDGRYDFDVELKPDFLGKVSIKLTMKDGSIRMQIKTDDASVKGMLSDQTSSLQSALKEKGITLSSIDVTCESQTSLSDDRLPFGQNSGGNRQNDTYYAQTEATGFEPAAEPYSYYIGNSSVEFLA